MPFGGKLNKDNRWTTLLRLFRGLILNKIVQNTSNYRAREKKHFQYPIWQNRCRVPRGELFIQAKLKRSILRLLIRLWKILRYDYSLVT